MPGTSECSTQYLLDIWLFSKMRSFVNTLALESSAASCLRPEVFDLALKMLKPSPLTSSPCYAAFPNDFVQISGLCVVLYIQTLSYHSSFCVSRLRTFEPAAYYYSGRSPGSNIWL